MADTGSMNADQVGSRCHRVDLQIDRPHPARVDGHLPGGKANYAADRATAAAGLKANPKSPIPAGENRAFPRRAVRYLARAGNGPQTVFDLIG